jgi:elongation factor P hydroxylase
MEILHSCTAQELRKELSKLGYEWPNAEGGKEVIQSLFGVLLVLVQEVRKLRRD